MRRIITLALLVAVLPGPGCDDATERLERTAERLERAGERAQELATDFILPPEHEETLGDQLAREIAAESRLISDGPVVRYVDQLGRELLRAAAGRPEAIDFDFHVVRDDAINAFAIPGGHIYVTTGLLKAAESEAELVAVLAHEIAHVTERHVAERMTAAFGVTTLTRIVLGEEVGMIEQLAAELLSRGFLLKYSRDHEREADQTGLSYVVETGHSPAGYVAFFQRLAEQPSPPALLSTHPNPAERVENARQAIKSMDRTIADRPLHRERYQAVTRNL